MTQDTTHKILIVDDEVANLRLMERLFRRNYEVITALSGKEGLKLLKQHDFALILSDQRMPEMTGIEFLKLAAKMRQQTVRVIITGYIDVNALVEAINSGVVYKYVTKPWVNEDLKQTVKRGIENYEANKRVHSLVLNNARLNEQVKSAQNALIQLVTNALNAKDEDALGHARRTSAYAIAIGSRLAALSSEEIEQLALAALFHNIGRIGTPTHVFKTAQLTDKERRVYSDRTERILMDFPDMADVASAVRYHRENYDGTGYPQGLNGDRIPLFSRIIAVASAYDDLTSQSSVEKSSLHENAVAKLREEAGTRFDPAIVEAFCESETFKKINIPSQNLPEQKIAS